MDNQINTYHSSIVFEAIEENNIDFFNNTFINWFKNYKKNLGNYHSYNHFIEMVSFAGKQNSHEIMKYFFESDDIINLFDFYPYKEKHLKILLDNTIEHNNEELAKIICNSHPIGYKVLSQIAHYEKDLTQYPNNVFFDYCWNRLLNERNDKIEIIKDNCSMFFKNNSFTDSVLYLQNILKNPTFKDFPYQYQFFLNNILKEVLTEDNVQLVEYILYSKDLKYNPNCLDDKQSLFVHSCSKNSLKSIDIVLDNLYEHYINNNNHDLLELNTAAMKSICSFNYIELLEKVLNHKNIKPLVHHRIDFDRVFNMACADFSKELLPVLLKSSLYISDSQYIHSSLLNNFPHWRTLDSYNLSDNIKQYLVIDIMDYIFNEPILNPNNYNVAPHNKVEYSTIQANSLLMNYIEQGAVEIVEYLLFDTPTEIKDILQKNINEDLIHQIFYTSFLKEKGKDMLNYFIHDLQIPYSETLEDYLYSFIHEKDTKVNNYIENKELANYAIEQYSLLKFQENLDKKINVNSNKNTFKKKKL